MKRRKSKRFRDTRARHAAGLFDELVIDNFAGGGGASIGIERALGRAVDAAVNHDAEAVALHQANHPHTLHYCESVWTVRPEDVTGGRPVGLAWFSPDCKDFSRAKGGQPVAKKIRGLAWVVIRWAKRIRPRVIMLENVREFAEWGPLIPKTDGDGAPLYERDGTPKMVRCPLRKGKTFRLWLDTLKGLGYAVEWRNLNAADYGAPTHRRRLFLVARRDGLPIVWPEPTHGPGRSRPWRTAAECIDWSLPCPSIFLTRAEARGLGIIRPLAEKTMRRIALGLKRFVFDNPKPFIVRVNHGGDHFRGQAVEQPLSTVTGSHGQALAVPWFSVIEPVLERVRDGFRGQAADAPLGTITSVARPGLVVPTLLQYNQEKGNEVRGQSLEHPLNTITSDPRFALVAPHITKFFGGVVGSSVAEPLPTVTAVDHNGIVAANLVRLGQTGGNGHYVNGPDAPLGTVVSKNEHCLVTSHLTKFYGTNVGAATDEPLPTITGQGNHIGEVRAFLTKYYSKGPGQPADAPLDTVTATDRFGLVYVAGERYAVADIGLRMLSPRELFRCQGFPEDYRIEITTLIALADGRVKRRPLPKSAQVRMVGNSVSPVMSEALVRANLIEVPMTEEVAS